MHEDIQDVVIIGGGIMGLSTAYAASHFTSRVTILEKSTIGIENKQAASFSYTRSIRNDYLDPFYARLAYEARRLWLLLQKRAAEPFLIECGCLNIASANVTPDLANTYAVQSYQTLVDLHLRTEALSQAELQQRFPQFAADLGRMDCEAGFLYVPEITRTLLTALREKQVSVEEHVDITRVQQRDGLVYITTSGGEFVAKKLVIVAGLGTNEVLKRLEGCKIQFSLLPDRPSQCKYFIPTPDKKAQFTADVLPVFAYLDVGIYGHPLYEGKTPGVKIGFYNPPDAEVVSTNIRDVHSFVDECMPALRDAQAVDVQDVDQCFYDLVADDNFILGNVPEFADVYVGVGWRGTGYKYAPWVGQTLMQLALQGGTVYDIARFAPQRFISSQV
ncbi:MAG TPA: FAD-dependent oxidoreductase [Ktedonobacteraceae bacterium]|jgi:glycine/D-amino acid oxidase-like deaminating enzyme|nr:FAD-dependent oxidoreductase [Ktedonobacteraceae bacterium]